MNNDNQPTIPPGHFANSGPNLNANFDYNAPVPAMLLQVWSTIAQTVLSYGRPCLTRDQVIALVTTPQILFRYAKNKKALHEYMRMDQDPKNQLVKMTFAQVNYCLG